MMREALIMVALFKGVLGGFVTGFPCKFWFMMKAQRHLHFAILDSW